VIDDRRRRIAYVLLGAVAVSLAGTWVAGKIAVQEIAPVALAVSRFAVASVLLAAWILVRGGSLVWPRRRDLPFVMLMAGTGVAGFSLMFLFGLQRTPAADGAILVPGLAPIVAATVGSVLYPERPPRQLALGLASALPGLVLVVGPSVEQSQARLLGDACFLVAALCWGTYTALGRVATSRFGVLNATLYALVAGTVLLVPLALLEGGWETLMTASSDALRGFLYLTVVGTVVAYVLYYEGVARIGVGRASSFTLAVPVVGVALTVVFLGERPSLLALLGGALVLAALWIILRAPGSGRSDESSKSSVVEGTSPGLTPTSPRRSGR